MKILVTGGAGFIGGTVTRLLLAAGHSATVFDNLSHSNRLPVAKGAEFVEGDLADRALLKNTLEAGRFDAAMHFAARIKVAESMKRPEHDRLSFPFRIRALVVSNCVNLQFPK
jgi:UDP-glucose 4-epimerase